MMKIIIASDHAGFQLKKHILDEYQKEKYASLDQKFLDVGPYDEESMDYPISAHKLARIFQQGVADFGILICGTGNGMAMTANKYPEIRCGLAWSNEVAKLIRQHNDANVLAIPARFISKEEGLEIVKEFLTTPFEGGRHQRRVNQINISAQD